MRCHQLTATFRPHIQTLPIPGYQEAHLMYLMCLMYPMFWLPTRLWNRGALPRARLERRVRREKLPLPLPLPTMT
jgi:hypothetical protein